MTNSEDKANAGVRSSLRHSSRAKKPSRRAEEMHLAEKVGEKIDGKTRKIAATKDTKGTSNKMKKGSSRKENMAKDEDDGGEYEQQEDDSEEEEDDDGKEKEAEEVAKDESSDLEPAIEVFCVCRKGDDGRPMVFCAECNDWFHFKCVNLTKRTAETLLEYICPPCSEKTGKNSKSIDDQEESEASGSPFRDISKQSTSPPLRPSGPAKRKSMEEDGMRKRSRGESPPISPRKTSISNARPVEASRKISGSGSAPAGSISALKARSEALRMTCVDQLKSTFKSIFAEVTSDEKKRIDQSSKYTVEFEESLFEAHHEFISNTTIKIASKLYTSRLRSYLFNLKDKENITLRQRIAFGELAAKDLATMKNDELANDAIRKEVENRKKENLEQSILKKERAPLRKLTHKGEIDIEYEATQSSRLAEEQKEKDIVETKIEKNHDSNAMSPPAVSRPSAIQASPTSSTNPRRVSTSLQSPTMSFDFENVWTGAEAIKESEEGQEGEDEGEGVIVGGAADEGKVGGKDNIIADVELEGEERADDFIDDFLGMPDESNDLDSDTNEAQIVPTSKVEEIKWRGAISMPEEGIFTGKIQQVAGREIQSHEWNALFPSLHSLIEGRLPTSSATPYLEQSRLTLRTELVVMTLQSSWEPESLKEAPVGGPRTESENKTAFAKLLSYFQGRGRYGVLPPHPSARGTLVKDFYIAPLPKDAPEPRWLEFCMKEDALKGAALNREEDIFVIVAVLFRQSPRQQSDITPAFSPPQSQQSIQGGSGNPHGTNLNNLLGGNTLQNLLKAVGGQTTVGSTASAQMSNQDSNFGGEQVPPLSSHHPSIEALSEMPRPQLEDMLKNNPSLVNELHKTLEAFKSAPPRPSSGPPPGPPPPPPPGIYGHNRHQSPHLNNPYVQNNYQQHNRPNPVYSHYGANSGAFNYPPQSYPDGADQGWHQNPNYYGRPSTGYVPPPGSSYSQPTRGGHRGSYASSPPGAGAGRRY